MFLFRTGYTLGIIQNLDPSRTCTFEQPAATCLGSLKSFGQNIRRALFESRLKIDLNWNERKRRDYYFSVFIWDGGEFTPCYSYDRAKGS